jgi:hypothetical protein
MWTVWDPSRGEDRLRFNRPHTFFVVSVRDSGKSACLEHIGENFLEQGHKVLDLFGSRDGEGLAWLRSPYAKDKKILLIHGDNTTVSGSFDTQNISGLGLNDFNKYDILISASPLYSSMHDEFTQVNRVVDVMYKRTSWKTLIYMIVRESGNLYYQG